MRKIAVFLLISLCLAPGWGQGEALVRLHIIANSDSLADQGMKLKVRDEVLAAIAGLGPREGTAGEALQAIREAESVICQAARRAGFEGAVGVEAGWFYFEVRELAGRCYPAGVYPAARIILGEGAGRNWWGLLNPELTQAVAGGGEGLTWYFPAIFRQWLGWGAEEPAPENAGEESAGAKATCLQQLPWQERPRDGMLISRHQAAE